jgi:hypothetical protein
MMQTAEEMILRNMSRAEKRGSKADLRDIAEKIHTQLQAITIPEKGR